MITPPTQAPSPPPGRLAGPLRSGLPVAGLLLLGLLAYANSLSGAFVFDDVPEIRDNPLIRDLGNYLGSAAGYRAHPNRFVAYLSFALNYRFSGFQLPAWHATNLAIHLGNALLVYALVVLAFRTPRLRGSALAGSSRVVAFVGAALFVTHPLQTQAVSYLVQRLTSLAALLYLATLALYLAWRLGQIRDDASRARGGATYGLLLATALLATRTKEIAITLPAAAALLEVALFGPLRRRQALGLLPLLAIALLIPASVLGVGRPVGQVLSDVSEVTRLQTAVGRLDYLRTELDVVARYLRLLAWPTGQNLDHDVPIATSFREPRVAWGAALHLGLLGLAALLWRRTAPGAARPFDPAARLVAVGIAFFYLALLVESSVIPIVDVMYEHRVYLPSAGALVAMATGSALLLRLPRGRLPARALVAGAVAVSLGLAWSSLLRNRVWWTELALWRDAAAKSPGKARPQRNLGGAWLLAGRPAEAVAPLRESVRLEPGSAKGRAQLGSALLAIGREAEGEAEVRESLRLAPDDPESLFNLGMVLSRTGRADEARQWFARFLEVAPPSYAAARKQAAARLGR